MDKYKERCSRLKDILKEVTKENVMLAFSGEWTAACSQSYYVRQRRKQGRQVVAVTMATELHPAQDAEIARKVAEESGAVHKVICVDELSHAGIQYNPENRCYLCKSICFRTAPGGR